MKKILSFADFYNDLISRRFILVIVLISLCFLSCSQEKQDPLSPFQRKWLNDHDGKLILVEYNGFPPLEFRNDQDEWVGISSDYIRLIEKTLAFKFTRIRSETLNVESWNDLIENQIITKCNLQKTPSRSEHFLFTDPYIEFPHAIIVNKEIKGDFTLDKLEGMKISVAKLYAIHEFLLDSHPQLELDLVAGDLIGLRRVAFNRSDATIVNFATASFYIEKEGLANLRFAGTVGKPNRLSFASSNKYPVLNQILAIGLAQISEKEKKTIYSKWISLDQDLFISSRKFWNIVIFASVAAIVVTLLVLNVNRILKKQVEQKTKELQEELEARQKMEKQLLQAQKMEAIGTFAGGIAHDFNNVLGTIIGYGEMMEMYDAPEGSRVQKRLGQILKASYRAKALVQQILTFSRKTEQQIIAVHLNPVITEVLDFLRATLPANIDLKKDNQCREDIVLADPTQIYQVLMNLCVNASQAMLKKGGTLEINLTDIEVNSDLPEPIFGLESGPYVKIIVTDTGTGMDEEVMEHIFEPFFTTKKQGEGSGMGLAIAHGIVKGLNGTIIVHSELGTGSIFEVFLPQYSGKTDRPEQEELSQVSSPKGSILFVDDEAPLTEYAKEILEHLGHDVVINTDSVEALNFFRDHPDSFDLVITDQTMPNLTGIELTKKIKMIRPDLPIILCSGLGEPVSASELKAIGIENFVQKPLGAYKLAKIIERVFKKH